MSDYISEAMNAMDWESIVIYVCVVGASALSLYLISIHGTREKSYEEALAEQKTRSLDLMGTKSQKKKTSHSQQHNHQSKKSKHKKHNNKENRNNKEKEASNPLHEGQIAESKKVLPENKKQEPTTPNSDEGTASASAVENATIESIEPTMKKNSDAKNTCSNQKNRFYGKTNPVTDFYAPNEESLENNSEYHNSMAQGNTSKEVDISKQTNAAEKTTLECAPPVTSRSKGKIEKEKDNNHTLSSEEPKQTTANTSESIQNVIEKSDQEVSTNPNQVVNGFVSNSDFESSAPTKKQNKKNKTKDANKKLTVKTSFSEPDERGGLTIKFKSLPLTPEETEELIEVVSNKQNSDWVSKKKNYSQELKNKENELRLEKINTQELQSKFREFREMHESERTKWNAVRSKLENTLDQRNKQLKSSINEYNQFKNEKKQTENTMQDKIKNLIEENKKSRQEEEKLGATKQALETEIRLMQKQIEKAFQSNTEMTNNYKDHLQRINEEGQRKESALYRDIQRLNQDLSHSQNEYFILQNQYQAVNEKLSNIFNQRSSMQNFAVQVNDDEQVKLITAQKEKNDELRNKNCKLLEALETTEKKWTDHLQNENSRIQNETDQAKKKAESDLLAMLCSSLGTDAASVQDVIDSIRTMKDEEKRLEGQVVHYQKVLTDTESLLSNLEQSLRTEETKWMKKLKDKEMELQALKLLARSDFKLSCKQHHMAEWLGALCSCAVMEMLNKSFHNVVISWQIEQT